MIATAIVSRPISLRKLEELFTDLVSRFNELIGPLSSIIWLAGFDELIDAVYDPAIALQVEVRLIPTNIGVAWILQCPFEESNIIAT
jgi:hypothetical protein